MHWSIAETNAWEKEKKKREEDPEIRWEDARDPEPSVSFYVNSADEDFPLSFGSGNDSSSNGKQKKKEATNGWPHPFEAVYSVTLASLPPPAPHPRDQAEAADEAIYALSEDYEEMKKQMIAMEAQEEEAERVAAAAAGSGSGGGQGRGQFSSQGKGKKQGAFAASASKDAANITAAAVAAAAKTGGGGEPAQAAPQPQASGAAQAPGAAQAGPLPGAAAPTTAAAAATSAAVEGPQAMPPQAPPPAPPTTPPPSVLRCTLHINNCGDSDMKFTAGLLTHLAAQDIRENKKFVKVLGLGGKYVLNYAADPMRPLLRVQEDDFVFFDPDSGKNVDDLYVDFDNQGHVLYCPGSQAHVEITHPQGFKDLEVLHPAAAAPDVARRCVCLGSVKKATPVNLKPGESWSGAMVLTSHNEYWELPPFEKSDPSTVPVPRPEQALPPKQVSRDEYGSVGYEY